MTGTNHGVEFYLFTRNILKNQQCVESYVLKLGSLCKHCSAMRMSNENKPIKKNYDHLYLKIT